MGFELNTKAYSYFVKLEVGLREFFIEIIRIYGIQKWSEKFLGKVQSDTISVVVNRINEAERNKDNFFGRRHIRISQQGHSFLVTRE